MLLDGEAGRAPRSAGEGVIFREGSDANRSQRWVKEREPAR